MKIFLYQIHTSQIILYMHVNLCITYVCLDILSVVTESGVPANFVQSSVMFRGHDPRPVGGTERRIVVFTDVGTCSQGPRLVRFHSSCLCHSLVGSSARSFCLVSMFQGFLSSCPNRLPTRSQATRTRSLFLTTSLLRSVQSHVTSRFRRM